MSFHDIHAIKNINAKHPHFLINDLNYLKDDTFLPVKSVRNDDEVRWISTDSTTLDAQKSVRMCLDSAPMNSYIKDYWRIYDKDSDINRYKSIYYNREDLPGQIQYYVDPEMTNPFFPPLFPENTRAFGAVFIDPMNNAQYDFRRSVRQPVNCNDCGIAEIRDLQHHREDILSNIMRPRNRREYEPVHFNFTTRYQP